MNDANNLGKVTQLRPRPSELPIDTNLSDWSDDDESSMRMIGYVLLGVTFIVFGVLLWPFIA